jgi:FixJ family two-component response regulator
MPNKIPKVLVVDDEESYLNSFVSLFSRKAGGQIDFLTANSGEEALKIIDNKEIAVIVSDQRMPGMTGSEFLAKASKTHPECVRVLLTGYADIDAVVDSINKGEIYRYINKNSPLKELESVIKQSIERYECEETKRKLLDSKNELSRILTVQENLSIVGNMGQEMYQRMEKLVMRLFEAISSLNIENNKVSSEFQKAFGALHRLHELTSFKDRHALKSEAQEVTDINMIIEEAVAIARKAAESSCDANFNVELAKNLPKIPIQRGSFNRMIKELLENALLFSPEQDKSITVRTADCSNLKLNDKQSLIQIEIQNSGPAALSIEIAKMFAPFYTTLPNVIPSDGTSLPPSSEYNLGPYFHYGFGLSMAQWIASLQHKGMIELISEPNKGTSAIISLPKSA